VFANTTIIVGATTMVLCTCVWAAYLMGPLRLNSRIRIGKR
jgi:hypothetical protein